MPVAGPGLGRPVAKILPAIAKAVATRTQSASSVVHAELLQDLHTAARSHRVKAMLRRRAQLATEGPRASHVNDMGSFEDVAFVSESSRIEARCHFLEPDTPDLRLHRWIVPAKTAVGLLSSDWPPSPCQNDHMPCHAYLAMSRGRR